MSTIIKINEIKNKNNVKLLKPITEKQDIYIPGITDKNISRRNGMIYLLTGSGGSGKSSLILSMFKSKKYYRGKFDNIYYFCPACSMDSINNHPFKNHDKVYNELTVNTLSEIYNELSTVPEPIEKEKKQIFIDLDEDLNNSDTEIEEPEIEYNCILIDDMGDQLKSIDIQKMLSKMMIKARHIKTAFIFLIQSYYLFPKILRKQLTYTSIFKPKNVEEWNSIAKEILHMNKDNGLVLHDYIYDEDYAHLDLDTTNNKIYKNFNLLEINN
jgi:energy-coupling factor transporter ATP-binding protein EcfA2